MTDWLLVQTLPTKTLQSKFADVEIALAIIFSDGADCPHQLLDDARGHHITLLIVKENVLFARSTFGARDNAD